MNLDPRPDAMDEEFVPSTSPNRNLITHYFKPLPSNQAPKVQLPPPTVSQSNPYQTTFDQVGYRQFGIEAYENLNGDFSSSSFGGEWRMKATEKGFGGSGKDEMTSTSTAREFLKKVDANPNLENSQKQKVAAMLSMQRTDTDALVWDHDEGYQGHPGALRYTSHQTDWASKGHWTKDNERARAAKTEFAKIVDDPSTAKFVDISSSVLHANARTGVETVRSFSMPFEQFEQIGPSKKEVYHTSFGDISDPKVHKQMATYVHNAREREKWDTAAKLRQLGLDKHVPDTMQEYLKAFGNDHHQAMGEFYKNVSEKSEQRVNVAKTSQADVLDPGETLRETVGRKRALSDPRMRR